MDRSTLVGIVSQITELVPEVVPYMRNYDLLKTVDQFTTKMTNDVHALYSGVMRQREFYGDMKLILTNQLTEAWNMGADEMSVLPADMTPDDLAVLDGIIKSELGYLDGLANDVLNAKQEGTGWKQFSNRIDLWVNRYSDVQNQAKIYFGEGKDKLVWHLGQTEEHCDTCARLNGIVAWATEWNESGVAPQNPPNDLLECEGWKCDCSLDSTNARRTNNALDKILSITGG